MVFNVVFVGYPVFRFFDSIYNPNNKIDFVISLGGDGSILSAVSRMKNKQLPILGIHIGELGFLNQSTKSNYLKCNICRF